MTEHFHVRCRAKVADACYDGKPTRLQFGEDLPMPEDGTFDGDTIVCDSCYVKLLRYTPSGRGLNDELPAAIEAARADAGT